MRGGKMKKSILGLFSIFALVISSLFCFVGQTNRVYAADDAPVNAVWLFSEDDNTVYQSTRVAGTVTGYGNFRVGKENVQLTTSSSTGFQLVGWQLIFSAGEQRDLIVGLETSQDESGNTTQFVNASSLTDGEKILTTNKNVTYSVQFNNLNDDEYFEEGTFTISQVNNDAPLKIRPVYDYIYQNVELSADMLQIVDVGINHTTDNSNTIYYHTSTENAGITEYSNAVVDNGESKFYFRKLYSNGTKFYTLHTKEEEEQNVQIEVEYSKGAYRIADEVGVELAVDTGTTAIDVQTVSYNNSQLTLAETTGVAPEVVGQFALAKNEYLLTTKLFAKIKVALSVNHTTTLTATWHNLYKANLNLLIDDVAAGDNSSLLVEALTVENAYSKVGDTLYYVKTAADNAGLGLIVSATSRISKQIDGEVYEYYKFGYINDQQVDPENSSLFISYSTKVISSEINIFVNYVSMLYNVDFQFALIDNANNVSVITGTYNLESSLSLARGEEATVNKTNASNNVGYTFYGFAASETNATENTSLVVAIDAIKPTNKTILMVFKKADYLVKLENYNTTSLNDKGTTIYPIASAVVARLRGDTIVTSTLTSANLLANSATFNLTLNIGDVVAINCNTNRGLTVLGYKINGQAEIELKDGVYTLQLTKELISAFINQGENADNTLHIWVYEGLETYTITLFTEPTRDTHSNSMEVMADLGVKIDNGPEFGTTSEEAELPTNIKVEKSVAEGDKIIISGLTLYQSLVFSARGRSKSYLNEQGQPVEYTYMFNRFTQDGVSAMTAYDVTVSSARCNYLIVGVNVEIKVEFSMAEARVQLQLEEGFSAALNLAHVQVRQNSETLTLDANFSAVVKEGASIELIVDDNAIAFGYILSGYTLRVGEDVRPTVTEEFNFNFRVASNNSSSLHLITIHFERETYLLRIEQSYVGGDSIDGVLEQELTIKDTEIKFNMPEGYYVSTVAIPHSGNELTTFPNLAQDNDYDESFYRYKLSRAELEYLIENYSVREDITNVITWQIGYSLHTYTVTVNFGIKNPKGAAQDILINYPSLKLTYSHMLHGNLVEGELTPANVDPTTGGADLSTVQFKGVPYKAKVQISTISGVMFGMQAEGWTITADGERPYAPDYATNGVTTLIINELQYHKTVYYKLMYLAYNINLVHRFEGSPIAYVNDQEAKQITLFDTLKIVMNPTSGYRFKRMTYKATEYTEFLYTEESWGANWSQLYYTMGGGAVTPNNSAIYDYRKTYYTREIKTTEFNSFVPYTYESGTWGSDYLSVYVKAGDGYVRNRDAEYNSTVEYYTISLSDFMEGSFNPNTYYTEGNSLTFNIEYEYFDIILLHNSALSGFLSLQREGTELNIPIENYAEYSMEVRNAMNEVSSVPINSPITVSNKMITVYITLNTVKLEENGKTVEYNLAEGVSLISIAAFEEYTFEQVDGLPGKYKLQIVVEELFQRVTSQDVITIIYTFKVLEKEVTCTTNIKQSSFYKTNMGASKFEFRYDHTVYSFGTRSAQSNGKSALTAKLQFLGRSPFYYENHYEGLFYISELKLYKPLTYEDGTYVRSDGDLVAGEEIPVASYAKYGIHIKDTLGTTFDVRFINDLVIELQVQPIITFEGAKREDLNMDGGLDYVFYRTYKCVVNAQNKIEGVVQRLTVGASGTNIQAGDIVLNCLDINYYYYNNGELGSWIDSENDTQGPIDCGTYCVKITLVPQDGDYSWIEGLELLYDVFVVIQQKDIKVVAEVDEQIIKTYDANSEFSFETAKQWLYFTDDAEIKIAYSVGSGFSLNAQNIQIYITYTNNYVETITADANEDAYYNLIVVGLSLVDSDVSRNFKLVSSGVTLFNPKTSQTITLADGAMKIDEVLQINKKQISLNGIQVYDKVFDGTTDATVKEASKLYWTGVLENDVLDTPDVQKLKLEFSKKEVDRDISVIINAQDLLTGRSAGNYKLNEVNAKATIYPYSREVHVDGYGMLTLFNNRGLEDFEYANLIPIDATLDVKTIKLDSIEYVQLYPIISKYFVSGRVFAVGYRLQWKLGVQTQPISRLLHLQMPNVAKLTGAAWVIGERTEELKYSQNESFVTVDLNQIKGEGITIILTQERSLLSWWQILLIVLLIILVIVMVVITIIVIRKRKLEGYTIHDKI